MYSIMITLKVITITNTSLKLIAKSLIVNLRNLERRMVVRQVAWRFGRAPKDWQIDHLHTEKGRQG